jgi:hypothetical protein
LHNELNLGEVLVLLEKTFFDVGCQRRCDGDFEFLARRFGALCERIGDRLYGKNDERKNAIGVA